MTRNTRKARTVTALVLAGAFSASLLGAAPGANATIIISAGNNPQPNEQTIQFDTDQTGTSFTGTTNQTGHVVNFTSSTTLETGGVGQAKLQGPGNTNIPGGTSITFSVPGTSFLDLIFNAALTGPGTVEGPATISAIDNLGNTVSQDVDLTNGGNFFTVLATNGEHLTSVELALGAGTVIGQVLDFRVSGIPEPASLAILGGALAAFGLLRRRKKS